MSKDQAACTATPDAHAELLAIHEAVMNPMVVYVTESDTYTVRRVKEFIQRAIEKQSASEAPYVKRYGENDVPQSATVSDEDAACKVAADLLRNEIVRLEYPKSMFPQKAEEIGRRQTAFQAAVHFLDPADSTVKHEPR